MEVYLTRRFIRRFEKRPKPLQERVREAVHEIGQSPHAGKSLSGSLEGDLSWRVGAYRVIYTIVFDRICVETVRHRKDAYR